MAKSPVIGTATCCAHPGETFPLVDYDQWKDSLDVGTHWDAYLQLLKSKPVLGYKIRDRAAFWRRVTAGDYVVFEHLAPAIIGVGNLPYLPPVPVYNEFAALNLLAGITEGSDSIVPVADFLEDSIKSLDLGDRTPWFVRPNNWKTK